MDVITLDFETYYAPDYTLSKLTTEQYLRDPRFEVIGVSVKLNTDPAVFFPAPQVAAALADFNWDNAMLVGHNLMFDGAILNWHYGITPKAYADTLSMARGLGLQAQVGGSLKALTDYFIALGYPLPPKGDEVVSALGKRYADFNIEALARYAAYCRNDTEATYQLFKIFMEVLNFPVSELRVIDETMRMFCDPLLRLDGAVLAQHLNDVVTRQDTLLDRVGVTIDQIRSDAQFAELLRERFVEPPVKVSARTGKVAYAFSKTDEDFLALLDDEDEDVQALVECRLGNKSSIEQSRTERFIGICERGALPVPLQYYAAHTGRFGGTDKVNLQNLPRGGKLRDAIVAPPGHVLVVGDSAQIEARMLAWLAQQHDLVAAFAAGDDIYSSFASDVFGVAVTKADKERRFVGKTSILGLGYGMGPPKFQGTLRRGNGGIRFEMELGDASGVVAVYRNKYAMIPELWKQGKRALDALLQGTTAPFGRAGVLQVEPVSATISTPQIRLPNGMAIRYPGLRAEEGDKGQQFFYTARKGRGTYEVRLYGGKLVENVVQALARIVVTDQWMQIKRRAIKERVFHRSPVVAQVHDELVCCVPITAAREMQMIMEEEMHRAPDWAAGLPVACEVGAAYSYGDAK
jgi:DNA polymerase